MRRATRRPARRRSLPSTSAPPPAAQLCVTSYQLVLCLRLVRRHCVSLAMLGIQRVCYGKPDASEGMLGRALPEIQQVFC